MSFVIADWLHAGIIILHTVHEKAFSRFTRRAAAPSPGLTRRSRGALSGLTRRSRGPLSGLTRRSRGPLSFGAEKETI